jgi:oligoendopeptidase F
MAAVAAACLNAIVGQEWVLAERRGWADLLEGRLRREGIERQVFDLAREATGDLLAGLRRFARTKARLINMDALPYWEIAAPLPGEPRWTWAAATDLIIEAFTHCDPELGKLATTAVRNGWIDAAPRRGKRTTALCLPMRDGESRVLLNFDGTADSILRLAHELGHAYHHANQAGQTEWQRTCPLVLRETAAMAAEQAVANATASRSADRTYLRGAWLARVFRTCTVGLARFRFEEDLVRLRRDGPLTATQLGALAVSSQHAVFGDAVEAGTLPGHVWISHPHLYSSRFNSLPYHLARIMAAAAFSAGPAPHLSVFLANTGLAAPAELFATHRGGLTSARFWESGVRAITGQIDQFAAADSTSAPHASAPAESGGAR